MSSAYRLVYLSLLIALSLSLFLLEGLIPLPFLAPGAKLGLSNLVTVIALYTLPRNRDALLVLLIRICLSAFFGGGPTILLYSLCGGLLAFSVMTALKRTGLFSIPGTSAAGGFFHNLGQLAVASCVMESQGLWNYLPILGACGLFTGLLIGLLSTWIIARLGRFSWAGW